MFHPITQTHSQGRLSTIDHQLTLCTIAPQSPVIIASPSARVLYALTSCRKVHQVEAARLRAGQLSPSGRTLHKTSRDVRTVILHGPTSPASSGASSLQRHHHSQSPSAPPERPDTLIPAPGGDHTAVIASVGWNKRCSLAGRDCGELQESPRPKQASPSLASSASGTELGSARRYGTHTALDLPSKASARLAVVHTNMWLGPLPDPRESFSASPLLSHCLINVASLNLHDRKWTRHRGVRHPARLDPGRPSSPSSPCPHQSRIWYHAGP